MAARLYIRYDLGAISGSEHGFCVLGGHLVARVVQGPLKMLLSKRSAARVASKDWEAVTLAHINGVTGACLALGIRYAGSGNAAAAELLRAHILTFLENKKLVPDATQGQLTFV